MFDKKGKIRLLVLVSVIVLIAMFFVLSAVDINTKTYDKTNLEYGKISVLDSGSNKLAEYTLLDNTDGCLIDCHAEGIATLYTEGYLFENLKFKDRGDVETSIISYQFYIKSPEDYDESVPDTTETLTHGNGTSYTNVLTWKDVTKQRIVWQAYNNEILSAGDYVWRLEGIKDPRQSVDWIASSFDISFDEWALWEGENVSVEVFNSDGTFVTPNGVSVVRVLVVAGGGGGSSARGAGGGGGGFIYNISVPVSGNVNVVVGNGGIGGNASGGQEYGISGQNSSFGDVVAIGGGAGADGTGNACVTAGADDGGAGGGGASCSGPTNTGGLGLQSISEDGGYGTAGGNGESSGMDVKGAGGGGSNSSGLNTSGAWARGGFGNLINGTTYSEGGNGSETGLGAGASATANSGDGGNGGDENDAGGNGGSGIVIVIYEIPVNYTLTFNLTDSFTGEEISTSGPTSFDISCDNGFTASGVENPYNTSLTVPNAFAAGVHECTFSGLTDLYFDKTLDITADGDKAIDIPMSKEFSLTGEEHFWLEAVHDCLINGVGCF